MFNTLKGCAQQSPDYGDLYRTKKLSFSQINFMGGKERKEEPVDKQNLGNTTKLEGLGMHTQVIKQRSRKVMKQGRDGH